jgi:hypothetical protein
MPAAFGPLAVFVVGVSGSGDIRCGPGVESESPAVRLEKAAA